MNLPGLMIGGIYVIHTIRSKAQMSARGRLIPRLNGRGIAPG